MYIIRCASFDGDADRVVFFSHTADGFNLLDGDRIAVLAALLIRSLIADLNDSSNISVCSIPFISTLP